MPAPPIQLHRSGSERRISKRPLGQAPVAGEGGLLARGWVGVGEFGEVFGTVFFALVVACVDFQFLRAIAADGVVEISAAAAASGEDGFFSEAFFPQLFVERAIAEVVAVQ